MAPFVVGVNVTPKVHLVFAASVAPQGVVPFPAAEKSPLVLNVRLRAWFRLFVSVIVWEALVLPTFVVGNVRFAENDTGNCPVPVRVTMWGAPAALSLIVTVPGIDPVYAGLNVTVTVQVCPGVSRTPPQPSVSV